MREQKPRILIIDDDEQWLKQVPLILEDEYYVEGYATIDQGLQAIQDQFYDVLLLDLNFDFDSRTGLDLFRQIHALDRGVDVIVLSAETDLNKIIELFNAGVSQYISKPALPKDIREKIKKTIEQREIRLRAMEQVQASVQGKREFNLIGSSKVMKLLREEIARIGASKVRDILLLGETGTGKEVVARMLAQEDRCRRFIAVHCGALTDTLVESELFGHIKGAFTGADRDRVGAFEAAAGGFVFLDEIGEMPLSQQAKLLRVLQERKVQRVGSVDERPASFRCISATHVDLQRAIIEKKFREDLYFRVSGDIIKLPPLRDHVEDIPELVYHFITNSSNPDHRNIVFTQEALSLLQGHSWPGNVRELERIVERLCNRAEGKVIREKDVCNVIPEIASLFSSRITKSLVGQYGVSLIASERKRFEKAIIEANGDRTRAAEILGLSRASYFRKAKDLGLVKERRIV